MNSICVLGLGYIGLPTAAIFATHGFQVLGIDVDNRVVDALDNGDVNVNEPGLKTLVQGALKSGNLRVACQPEPSDAFIIAVPTPLTVRRRRRSAAERTVDNACPTADLSHVVAAANSIVPDLRPGNLVVLESTVPPRTTVDVVLPILRRSGISIAGDRADDYPTLEDLDEIERPSVFVAQCPERVLPGHILEELVRNHRVIGGVDPRSAEMAKQLYASFLEGEITLTDATTAEMVKLMENAYRDVNIALANEFALVAERVGINVWEAIELANRHPRVNLLKPGPGVGGHCIAVDPWFVVQAAPEMTPLIQTARRVNEGMPAHVAILVGKAMAHLQTAPSNIVIACLGLAYKADVDDTRESPAVEVVELLRAQGFEVRPYDPHVPTTTVSGQVGTLEEALADAGCLVILTDHTDFRAISPYQAASLMRGRCLIDSRLCIDRNLWEQAGFAVTAVGDRDTTQGMAP